MSEAPERSGLERTTAEADQRTRQARGRARKKEILDHAVELLARKGFRGTPIAEIAGSVGMTHPGLLYYFGSKERLLLEVVAERDRAEMSAFRRFLDRDGATVASLRDVAGFIVDAANLTRLFAVLGTENFDVDDPLHDFFVDRYARARGLVADALVAAKRRGEAAEDLDVTQTALEVVSVLMGLELQWLMDPDAIDLIGVVDAYTTELEHRISP